jgi:hypothetical protein
VRTVGLRNNVGEVQHLEGLVLIGPINGARLFTRKLNELFANPDWLD